MLGGSGIKLVRGHCTDCLHCCLHYFSMAIFIYQLFFCPSLCYSLVLKGPDDEGGYRPNSHMRLLDWSLSKAFSIVMREGVSAMAIAFE